MPFFECPLCGYMNDCLNLSKEPKKNIVCFKCNAPLKLSPNMQKKTSVIGRLQSKKS